MKIVYNYGTVFLEKSLKPFLLPNSDKIEFGKMKIFIQNLGIKFSLDDWQGFQYHLANKKIVILENYKNIEESRILLDILEFVSLMKNVLRDLGLEEKDLKEKTEVY